MAARPSRSVPMAEEGVPWRLAPGGLELRVRVTPRGGWEGVEVLSDSRPVLKVRVRAVPENGAANEAVRSVLAKALGCPVSAVTLDAGATARVKTLRVVGDGKRWSAALALLTAKGT